MAALVGKGTSVGGQRGYGIDVSQGEGNSGLRSRENGWMTVCSVARGESAYQWLKYCEYLRKLDGDKFNAMKALRAYWGATLL
jgi:hypothetical protein